jgi:hypothetical protein
MRTLFLLTIIAWATSFAQNGNVRPATPKDLGEIVFKSLQEENYEMFHDCVFTESDCDIMAKNADAPDSLKVMVAKQMKTVVNRTRNASKANFDQLIAKGKENNIVWNKVGLNDIKFQIKKDSNIESADIYLLCTFEKTMFTVKLDNCHKSNAWLMMDKAQLTIKQ